MRRRTLILEGLQNLYQDLAFGDTSFQEGLIGAGEEPIDLDELSDLIQRVRRGHVMVVSPEHIQRIDSLLREWDTSQDVPLDVAVEMKEILNHIVCGSGR
jgi:hypothetical protein